MCDGYAGYDSLEKHGSDGSYSVDIRPVSCMVHVKRKFVEALDNVSPKDRPKTSAYLAIKKIQAIMHLDNKYDDLSIIEREKLRNEELKPALDEFFAWIRRESEITLPEIKYGKALTYALNQEIKIRRVLEHGCLELENNMAERAVKPFVIGRKNWLFSATPKGADASCLWYSLVETAKLNKLNPYEYIKYLLDTMRNLDQKDWNIESLLPWSTELPECVKNPSEE